MVNSQKCEDMHLEFNPSFYLFKDRCCCGGVALSQKYQNKQKNIEDWASKCVF